MTPHRHSVGRFADRIRQERATGNWQQKTNNKQRITKNKDRTPDN
jgi:hypothetical protein